MSEPNSLLVRLRRDEAITELDACFARFIGGLVEDTRDEILLAAALVSRQAQAGHICLELERVAARPVDTPSGDVLPAVERGLEGNGQPGCPSSPGEAAHPGAREPIVCPDLETWREVLRSCHAVGRPGDAVPLIVDGGDRLYLQRYWRHEQSLARDVLERVGTSPDTVNIDLLRGGLEKFFPSAETPSASDGQKLAVMTAVLKTFCIISGGPGTGKTWTVMRILALLLDQARDQGRGLSVALTAPTGKAANRLKEVFEESADPEDPSKFEPAGIDYHPMTVHRLIRGLQTGRRSPPDVIIVDEASMADMALMVRLAGLVPSGVRMVWLGDKDQLASVEAGAVLGDVCSGAERMEYSGLFRRMARDVAGIDLGGPVGEEVAGPRLLRDSIVMLETSFRFSESSGIRALSRAINRGDGERVLALLKQGAGGDISWVDPSAGGAAGAGHRPTGGQAPGGDVPADQGAAARVLAGRAAARLEPYAEAATPEQAFERLDAFRVLCAVRKGPMGVERMNRSIENALRRKGLINPYTRWYPHRPVLIGRNDYGLGLFNGDVGVIMPVDQGRGSTAAYFQGPAGSLRRLSPLSLPEHDTVYAMTVHKSQGSEFDHVMLVLPSSSSPVLTRELLYTGVTRARKSVEIWGREHIILEAVARRTHRASGLRDALWAEHAGCAEP